MANGQYNPSSPYYTHALGSNPCNFAANEMINAEHCASSSNALCYNTGGITMECAEPERDVQRLCRRN